MKKLILVATTSLLALGFALPAGAGQPSKPEPGSKKLDMAPGKKLERPLRFTTADWERRSYARTLTGDPMKLVGRIHRLDGPTALIELPISPGAAKYLDDKRSRFDRPKKIEQVGHNSVFDGKLYIEYEVADGVDLSRLVGQVVALEIRTGPNTGFFITGVAKSQTP